MKRIVILFIAITACLLTISAQDESSNDSTDQVRVTTSQIEYTDTPAADNSEVVKKKKKSEKKSEVSLGIDSEFVIAIMGIACVFGLPIVIVFLSFYFAHKKRKAKYQLIEKALESGQPIPEDFLRQPKNTLSKGITNAFTGIGLFIFLWAATKEFSIGCIGLFIMFMGLGQIVIHYTQDRKNEKPEKQDTPNKEDDHTPTIIG